jgi:hypothetical protein
MVIKYNDCAMGRSCPEGPVFIAIVMARIY